MMDQRQRDDLLSRTHETVVRVEERLDSHLRYHSHRPHWIASVAAVVSALAAVAAHLMR
jgi:hypothetical protein